MEKLKKYILEQVAQKNLNPKIAEMILKEMVDSENEPIAIIGMSGKFPNADNLEEYWSNLENNISTIFQCPEERKKDSEHLLETPYFSDVLVGKPVSRENVAYTKYGYLKDGIDKFDAEFFRIPPREAKYLDPSQRLFLETSWEAIEDAGYGGNKIYGTKTGVFVGKDTTQTTLYKHMTVQDPMHLTGSYQGILASRISYLYNLRGPSLVIDTACSSSLVAIHEACKSIRNNECDMAVAGGIQIMYSTNAPKGESVIIDFDLVESKSDTPRPFDEKADGTVFGEGVGSLLLKPLNRALEDNDPIHAVIMGSAINNDGASPGITAPSSQAQEQVILDAWKNAKVDPETISYIEAHGTATNLGDPIEIKGITNAFRKYTNKQQFCGIGSNKGINGHTVGASGVASLIKVVLSMKKGLLLPSTNFEEPNKFINFLDSPVYVNDQLREWKNKDTPKRAGVSSFGFSGTNCHMILSEGPLKNEDAEESDNAQIIMLSSRNERVLKELIKKYDHFLNTQKYLNLKDVCYTANTGRGQYACRIVLIVKNIRDLKEKIKYIKENGFEIIDNITAIDIFYGKHKKVVDKKAVLYENEIKESVIARYSDLAKQITDSIDIDAISNISELIKLAKYYISGADLDWDQLYVSKNRNRIHLPVYPLERIRVWAEPKEFKALSNTKQVQSEYKHPLLNRKVVETVDTVVFTTDVSVDTHWVLSEHIFYGNYVLPGISYIEIAREAISKVYIDCNIEIKNIIMPQPLVVVGDEVRTIYITIKKKQDHLEFLIASKTNPTGIEGDEVWVKHAEGKSYKLKDETPQSINIQEVIDRCNLSEHPDAIDKSNLVYDNRFTVGDRWDNTEKRRFNQDEELAEIKLWDEFVKDLDDFYLHPSQLDNAINASLHEIPLNTYLPFSYKSIKVFKRLPQHFYSIIRRKQYLNSGKETINFDVTLVDLDGNVLVDVKDYIIKKVHKYEVENFKNTMANGAPFYGISWHQKSLAMGETSRDGKTLVFKNNSKKSNDIMKGFYNTLDSNVIEISFGDQYEKLSERSYVVSNNEIDYQRLFKTLKNQNIRRMVHLTSLDEINLNNRNEFIKSQEINVIGLFKIVKSLVKSKIKENIDLVVIADYINDVTPQQTKVNPLNALVMGLLKVIPQEYNNITTRCIDIDDDTKIENIIKEIDFGREGILAYRNNNRYVQEFNRVILKENEGDKIEIKDRGVYVITGGTGGIGLEIATYLSEKNNVNIALLNRSVFPNKEDWNSILLNSDNKKLCGKIQKIKNIEQNGSKVELISTDVMSLESIEKEFSQLRKKYGRINGIIHGAGVAGVGYLINKEVDTFKSVISPKVNGTWTLDQATETDNMDFFIVFSSMATFQNMPGQGDYTSANSFLNAFSEYRNRKGKKTISICWPSWKETGMAVDYNATDEQINNQNLFKAITNANALQAFDSVLSSNSNYLITGDINFHVLNDTPNDIFSFELSEHIEKMVNKARIAQGEIDELYSQRKDKKVNIKGRGDGEYTETESTLAKMFAGVIGISDIDIYSSFNNMGGDSLLATQLVKVIDQEYIGIVDITDIFAYPSVEQMATYIDEKRGISHVDNSIEELEESKEEDELEDMFEAMLEETAVTKGN